MGLDCLELVKAPEGDDYDDFEDIIDITPPKVDNLAPN